MSKYYIDVTYTNVFHAEVEADDPFTACRVAHKLASEALPNEFECTDMDAKITNVEKG